jgi:D-alanine-D-alanine ligase
MNKIRVGIIFGGKSREREISFAGGRTVYDNLNKSLFEAIPLFADSFGNLCELKWEYVYKGTIRDFYPPMEYLANSPFQLYAENLDLTLSQQHELLSAIGQPISFEALKHKIDFAFLCLHGPDGEDGRLQGLLEYLQIPYSGSGILPSATGINKAIQKNMMVAQGFHSPRFTTITRRDYIDGKTKNVFEQVKKEIGLPCVIKPAGQGSSIGVTILDQDDAHAFMQAVEKAFFTRWVDAKEWQALSAEAKELYVRQLADIREGVGMPVAITEPAHFNNKVIKDPSHLVSFFNEHLTKDGMVVEALDAEATVMVEGFIEGREFSCIVVENENGEGIALPPTEIRKGKELFDYRSKYLPGLSRKITPIDLPGEKIMTIMHECERLFKALNFDVYARIDGFAANDGKIYLNDPNTTSGMMPSSFFFHQAAEIGLNPSQFLTYIIRTSLNRRAVQAGLNLAYNQLLARLDALISDDITADKKRTRVAVVLGGYSSERHISVESGRNVYEKLASSEQYVPFPVFLAGNREHHTLYRIPINLMLKDNADDIREKAEHFTVHPVIGEIVKRAEGITKKYAGAGSLMAPEKIDYQQLAQVADEVFIALHGRPGEDGEIQTRLEKVGLPYNGSGQKSSAITIDKYTTNEILRANGFLVAEHLLVSQEEWCNDRAGVEKKLKERIHFPFIAKPVDDGCSSAVKKIKTIEEFDAFCKLMFRPLDADLDPTASAVLHIRPKEEFPNKNVILVEELISRRDADHFLEVTGGMLTKFNEKGEIDYEVFEASEALAEGEVLSLEEKFLAGQGQNITPARYARDPELRQTISNQVKERLGSAARVLGVTGYCRIDAFVRVYNSGRAEVIFIEVNSLPGMTPATCIFHQAAINGYKPYEFIDRILDFGVKKQQAQQVI